MVDRGANRFRITAITKRRWDAIISDATRGVLVGRFLSRALSAQAQNRGQTAPQLVHIANSRRVYDGVLYNGFDKPARGHTRAIVEHLKPMAFERALLVTDMVDSGKCLRKLGAAVTQADIQPDFAIMVTPHGSRKLRRKIHAPRRSEVYALTSGVEPGLAQDTISQGIGLETVYGNPEPQESPYAWPWVGDVAYQLYDALAEDYVHERFGKEG